MLDILRFAKFDQKPKNGDWYTCDGGLLYKCADASKNDKMGWPDKNPKRVIVVLEKISISIEESEALAKFAHEKFLIDGSPINVGHSFSKP